MPGSAKPFDRETLEEAFERLSRKAIAAGKIVEISVYGGSALVLTTDRRAATRDVDAVFERDRSFVTRAAEEIAAEFGWPSHWLNDGVKGFLSAQDQQDTSKTLFRTYPDETHPGLRVFVASPSYLFAMKCMAMRIGGVDQNEDIEDIRGLGKILGVKDADHALSIVLRYYPPDRLTPKTQFGIAEIFGKLPEK